MVGDIELLKLLFFYDLFLWWFFFVSLKWLETGDSNALILLWFAFLYLLLLIRIDLVNFIDLFVKIIICMFLDSNTRC